MTVREARAGLEMVGSQLARESIGEQTYWAAPDMPVTGEASPTAFLLPSFDEYLVGYRERPAWHMRG